MPSTSLTSKSVGIPVAGSTTTAPARVDNDFDVDIFTPPCSNLMPVPSYCTTESFKIITLEPVAVMVTTESGLVYTKSPRKMADDRVMVLPLTNAGPWLYSMAEGVSAANNETGNSTTSKLL